MTHDEVLDKIRKLLRLSRSTNEHEAQRALEAALRLAARHHVDVASLELDPEVERVIHERFQVGERLSYITKLVLNVCVAFFHVEIILTRPDAVFIGTATDVAIAYFVLGYLSQACSMGLKEYEAGKRRRLKLSTRQNYIAGFIYGVRHRLSEAREAMAVEDSRFALVIAAGDERRKAYAGQIIPRTKDEPEPKVRRNWSAATQGWLRGKNTVIHTPLNAGKTTLLLQ